LANQARKKDRLSPLQWLHLLFRQPPAEFYHQPSVYLCGDELELEGFRRIVAYDEGKLCVEYGRSLFTVYGDGLRIIALSAHRLTLRGRFLRTDFSDK
jgi:hypothetical protein